MAYLCKSCGTEHEVLPDLGYRWPDTYFNVPSSERESRIFGDFDVCVIDNEEFYIRGVIRIPLINAEGHFGLGVWVSQKKENFRVYLDNYDTPEIGPFFGWLSNSITFYQPDTFAMKTMAHFQGNNLRPFIDLEPTDHPLYKDYSTGITFERAWEIAHHSGL